MGCQNSKSSSNKQQKYIIKTNILQEKKNSNDTINLAENIEKLVKQNQEKRKESLEVETKYLSSKRPSRGA